MEYRQRENRQTPIKYEINDNGCHICTSHASNPAGYPVIRRNRKTWLMSRYLYTLKNGAIAKGLIIRHKCDTPKCINLEHLELGTDADNVLDMFKRGRNPDRKGENSSKAKLTWTQVEEIRKSNLTTDRLAIIYEVTVRTINQILSEDTWIKQ